MKTLLIIAAICVAATTASADPVQVRGYVRADGTYVAPHVQTAPNDTKQDNYSTRGNVNPYTGKAGTVDPYAPREPRR